MTAPASTDSSVASASSSAPATVPAASEEHWQQAVALSFQQAQEEAERCLARAHEEAEACLAQAQEQAAALTQEAYEQGFQQGEKTAREEIAERFATLFTSLEQACEALSHGRVKALKLAEEDIITLALQLAQKIVRYEVSGHRQVLAATLQRALAYLVDCDRVVIRVNPADLVQAQELQPSLVNSSGLSTPPIMCGDESIGRGGCVVDSEFGSIDARIDAQFAELELYLRAALSQEGIS
jgi:flagellar assembly protein FliH